jgi:hypothetical protein
VASQIGGGASSIALSVCRYGRYKHAETCRNIHAKCNDFGDREAIMEGISSSTTIRARQRHLVCSLGDEVVILQQDSGVYYGLNAVGADIWNFIQQPRTVSEVVNFVVSGYAVSTERFQQDLLELIQELASAQLIETQVQIQNSSPM